MSATGRAEVRHKDDFYVTPDWCVEALVEHEDLDWPLLDPACGTGALLGAMHRLRQEGDLHLTPGGFLYGLEIDPSRYDTARWTHHAPEFFLGDFLSDAQQDSWSRPQEGLPRPATVLMNPPYRQAAKFVRAGLRVVRPGGNVVGLLRLNFLGSSRSRADLFERGSGLRKVYVLARRPSFTGTGTDSCEYAWFCWQQGYEGPILMEVIPV